MHNIFSFFNKKNSNQRNQPGYVHYWSSVGNDAFTDWALIIALTCIVAGSLIGVGGYVYIQTQTDLQGQGTVLPASTAASHFDVDKLKNAIATFDARANERVMLSKGYIGPKDPSLP
ncbi:MAG: hypothetical protein V4524_01405 [Patescibacteria group bacterium]